MRKNSIMKHKVTRWSIGVAIGLAVWIGAVALPRPLKLGSEATAVIGRPLTPFSYAGVARRTVRRSAYYY